MKKLTSGDIQHLRKLQYSENERKLRELLAIAYSGTKSLYMDDGELKDFSSAPFIDFRRDNPRIISQKMQERGMKNLRKSQFSEDEGKLRELLAFAYSGANLYTDWGELRDSFSSPFIDFRKDDPCIIAQKMQERGMKKLENREENSENQNCEE